MPSVSSPVFFTQTNDNSSLGTKLPSSDFWGQGIRFRICVRRRLIRFAAKEAAYKAFQPQLRLSWKQLEVWKHESGKDHGFDGSDAGKPYLRLWTNGEGKVDFPLSISHEKDYVVAVVMNTPIQNFEKTM